MLESAHQIITIAAKNVGLSKQEIDQFLEPDNIHRATLDIDGKTYEAYRVQHKNHLGPYKGGIRFHHEVDFEEVQALATLMSLKTAATNLPLGGGKGGVVIDPRMHDPAHIEAVSREYVRALHKQLGPENDIPAPDVNTNSQIIDWMVEEYELITGDKSKASFTGKSIGRGGSEGREEATGRGGVIVLREILRLNNIAPESITVAVQGMGNVGYYFAKIASEELGVKIVAVANSRKTILSVEGFDFSKSTHSRDVVDELEKQADHTGDSVMVLTEEADVLVCAALDGAITMANVKDVKAGYILELANGPVAHEAYETLQKNGQTVIPDIIANAGGVIVSYYEWLQNKALEKWSKEEVEKRLNDALSYATIEAVKYSKKQGVSLKQAAFEIAVRKLTNR